MKIRILGAEFFNGEVRACGKADWQCEASSRVPRVINFAFFPHKVFTCFVWISEKIAIISLYSINWLVFITETECVYCVVIYEYWNIMKVKLSRNRPTVSSIHAVICGHSPKPEIKYSQPPSNDWRCVHFPHTRFRHVLYFWCVCVERDNFTPLELHFSGNLKRRFYLIFHPSLVLLPGLLESFIYLAALIPEFLTTVLLKIRVFCVKLCRWVSSLDGIYVRRLFQLRRIYNCSPIFEFSSLLGELSNDTGR
jgi:hypothetical protein